MSPARPDHPVFYDPTRRRWRQTRRLALMAGALVAVLLGAVVVGIVVNPVLPDIGLRPIPHLPQASHLRLGDEARTATLTHRGRLTAALAAEAAAERRRARGPERTARAASGVRPATAVQAPAARPERIAFFVNWDDNSLVSLKANAGRIDALVPEWLHLTAEGRVQRDDPVREQQVTGWLREHAPGVRIVPLVNNFDDGKWRRDWLAKVLATPERRAGLVEELYRLVRQQQYAGVSIDFENVGHDSQDDLADFMAALYARFHPAGLVVSQSVPVDDRAFDFAALAESVDYLILMAYDEHASDNEPGPIASRDWFARSVRARLEEVPASKLVVGLGNYGYDWTVGGGEGTELSFQDALRTARESDARIEFDPASANPAFDYDDEAGKRHVVWYLDAVTAFDQLTTLRDTPPRGYAVWRLGSEDPGLWRVLERSGSLDASVAAGLSELQDGYDIDYEGRGEILKVTGTPKQGRRSVRWDAARGTIASQSIDEFPNGYVITRWGDLRSAERSGPTLAEDAGSLASAGDRRIALTFDDGPDGTWTPQILEILREKRAPAAFFIVGESAERHPELLRRIVDEGHELGNHTYTHPNIAEVGDARLTLEVNAVQRLLESRLGLRSLLFRPPYAEDVEPETPDQVRPLLTTSALGYYTVGLQIDPNDWARPGAKAIVDAVLEQAQAGLGHVVLLHDSGGDRSDTVEALPELIDRLRAAGFRIVSLSELVGLPRSAVMPTLPADERLTASLEAAGFGLITWTNRVLWGLCMLGIVLGIARFLVIAALAVRQRRHVPGEEDAPLPPVSVVIPAFNERTVIVGTVDSVLRSDWPAGVPFEVLVVDDGSNDGTADAVREAFAGDPRVVVLGQPNGGKSSALNLGFARASADVVIALDADTVFLPDTVRRLAARFADPRVVAVAGNARVGNERNVITRWQALEYVTSQNLDRRAFARLNCITVVPGAVGAWRRSAVLAAGGFGHDTLAEDADLTLKLLRRGGLVGYEDRALALTEAPERIGAFLKQRFRWTYGTLQAAWKHRATLFRRDSGTLGFVALPNVLVFQILFPLVAPLMDLLLGWSALNAGINAWRHPSAGVDPGLMQALWFYALFTLVDAATAVIGLALDRERPWRLLPWLLPQRFAYRQLVYYVAVKACVTALRGPRVGWGKLERTGNVATESAR
jgi:spore germination protein YaaH/peptidoglycan/xylan/chitin deacetylase (PgdA/CDA1 family)/GT2 family glycosyltransferase